MTLKSAHKNSQKRRETEVRSRPKGALSDRWQTITINGNSMPKLEIWRHVGDGWGVLMFSASICLCLCGTPLLTGGGQSLRPLCGKRTPPAPVSGAESAPISNFSVFRGGAPGKNGDSYGFFSEEITTFLFAYCLAIFQVTKEGKAHGCYKNCETYPKLHIRPYSLNPKEH